MTKKQTPLDRKEYYRVLKVSPEADHDEIKLAYAMAKQNAAGPYLAKLDEAWDVLKDRNKRAAYDAEGLEKTNYFRHPATLLAAIAVLVVVFVTLWLPGIQMRNKKYGPGQELVTVAGRQPFGTVVRFERQHSFPGGVTAPAYLVRMAGTGSEQWLPEIDLQASCAAR